MTPEGKIKRAIREVLASYGEHVYVHMPVPTGYGIPTLDFIGIACGQGFAIEAKRPGGSPTVRQLQTIEKMAKAGGKIFVIDNTDKLQELKTWLDETIKLEKRRNKSAGR